MSKIPIKKVNEAEQKQLSTFEKIGERFEAVKRRAFELFEHRGFVHGYDLDDWFQAEQEMLTWPAAELAEKEGAYELDITLPGFQAKDIEVSATPEELIVHAAMAERKETAEGNVTLTEFGTHDLFRRFHVPNPINVDKVAASLEKGVLHVKAPMAEKPKVAAVAAA